MRRIFTLLIIIFISFFVKAQENILIKELSELKGSDNQVNHILNLTVSNLEENKIITNLKEKLDSNLNSVISCVIPYKFSKSLKLSDEEKSELKKHVEQIAYKFAQSKHYILFEFSGGYAPIFGVDIKDIQNKKTAIVMLGGDCLKDETELKAEEIYTAFNNKMAELINE